VCLHTSAEEISRPPSTKSPSVEDLSVGIRFVGVLNTSTDTQSAEGEWLKMCPLKNLEVIHRITLISDTNLQDKLTFEHALPGRHIRVTSTEFTKMTVNITNELAAKTKKDRYDRVDSL
jgi:hypothetical protein